MLRWLLLLALTARTIALTDRWWCSGEAIDSMPEFTTDEERALMELEQQKAAIEARAEAKARNLGPMVTTKLVEKAMIKARDEAHDRVHLRQMQEAQITEGEGAELVPVQALMPAGVVAKMMQSEKEKKGA